MKVNVEILYLNKIYLKIENYEEKTVRSNIMQAIKRTNIVKQSYV